VKPKENLPNLCLEANVIMKDMIEAGTELEWAGIGHGPPTTRLNFFTKYKKASVLCVACATQIEVRR
jgi:hypothetical protein